MSRAPTPAATQLIGGDELQPRTQHAHEEGGRPWLAVGRTGRTAGEQADGVARGHRARWPARADAPPRGVAAPDHISGTRRSRAKQVGYETDKATTATSQAASPRPAGRRSNEPTAGRGVRSGQSAELPRDPGAPPRTGGQQEAGNCCPVRVWHVPRSAGQTRSRVPLARPVGPHTQRDPEAGRIAASARARSMDGWIRGPSAGTPDDLACRPPRAGGPYTAGTRSPAAGLGVW